jgi:serine/threonine-protein kinase
MSETPQADETMELLDRYLAQLQAGQRPDREAILRRYPELAPTLDCIDALESIAPPVGLDSPASAPPSESAAADEEMPRDFGQYELLGEIGRGGMGVVYRARQKELDCTVAIKMILSSHLASAEHVRRFRNEARAAARVRHPNVVHIHQVGQHHGQHYFTMEYVDGQSLGERVGQGPLDPQTAARLVAKVARAVEHLHQHGIVHRDLKPSNVLLDRDGEPYVTDFGLAKFFAGGSSVTATGVIAGTPCYMAPEQAAGRNAQVGPASDVYSLGAILYETLTGRPPFLRDSPLDTLMDVLGGEPPRPRELNRSVPRELERICLKCLSRSPGDRYASAAALAEDLDRFLKGEAIEARSPGLVQHLWTWVRRQPALASRVGTLGAFYCVELVRYSFGEEETGFNRHVSLIVAVWLVSAVLFQRSLKSAKWSIPARFGWGTLDALLLLSLLMAANGAVSALVVGYPLLIVASGLWLRVRFVWFMTALCLASYGFLVLDYYRWRPEALRQQFGTDPVRHVDFTLAMIAIALVVAYLVSRVRALSSYYGQKV